MIYIYDIECYKNYFSVTFKNVKTKEIINYIIYHSYQNNHKNELSALYKFIKINRDKWFVGYNSKSFDNQILNYIFIHYEKFNTLDEEELCQKIFDFMWSIIYNNNTEYKYRLPFKSIDLMKVGNVDKKSLKLVAVNLNWPVIQDLPIEPEGIIEDKDLDLMFKYNLNDVEITEQLYHKLIKDITVRWEIGEKYNIDLMSEPDSGMANRILEKMYSQESGITIKDLRDMRTYRKIIHYENIVFDDIEFKTPVLKKLLDEIRSQKYFMNQPYFNKSIIYEGVKYKLGIGGIHSDDKPGVFSKEDDKDVEIIDCDITSMYPNLIINNNLYPAHLSSLFLDLYKNIVQQRLKAKKEGRSTEAYVLKILVNSVFGKTMYEHHWLYDPLVGLRVTINGQLYMLMLIEALTLAGFAVLSANTDGIVSLVHDRELYKEVCNKWSKRTKFNLEYTDYKKYVRRDVNNYIVIKYNDSVKEKGVFLQSDEISLRQGIDKPIISKALYNLYVHNTPIESTIYDEQNIYSFCIAKKTDKKFVNEFHTIENGSHKIEELQKTVRFYISTNGGRLYKVDKLENKYISYCINRQVSILNNNNNNKDIKDYNIDYGYYIKETNKIVDEIINPQLSLF